jgi:hypothetical protein
LLHPLDVSKLPIFIVFLFLEVSLDFLKSLLLKDFLNLGSHSTHFFVLLELILVDVRAFWKLLDNSKLIVFLGC